MEKFKKITNFIDGIRRWIKGNPKEFWILLVILLTGAFLRLYRIGEYMTFLGDEGRDAIIVRRLLVYQDLILVGPGTSIGNMYLGPLYYYMMAPALFLAGYSPVGPSVQIALLGVLTIGIVWWIGREWFGKLAGIIAGALYAISPTVILYSRSSWNPNIMPFFATLSIYSIWQVWKKKSYGWLIVLGAAFPFVLQSHYLGLLLAPTLGIFWILTLRELKQKKQELRKFVKSSLAGLLLFSFLMSPLVIFDLRHNFINFSAMKKFFTERQSTVSARPWNAVPNLYPQFEKVNTRLVSGRNEKAGKMVTFLIVLSLAIFLKKEKKLLLSPPYILTLVWLIFALIGLGLYKQEIYDHYYGFFFAAPFLLLGGVLGKLLSAKNKGLKTILILVILYLVYMNLSVHPFRNPPQMQMKRAQVVSEKIALESGGKPFNLAVIAERNYEDGYQYFLEKMGLPVIDIDAQRPETVAEQLFVICEMPKDKCDPTHSAKAEVATFGWSKIEEEWEVFGNIVFKLIHTEK
ncbi:glycosyltransferase family 39 protein [Candidatus Woesebacteria bacterium]|nr:glycosyltransferase family 39 protein [Candidatus Woesebacteria bacterium]